jgi:dipeptidyl aminopeptidase/acylaminoacyl peptidase
MFMVEIRAIGVTALCWFRVALAGMLAALTLSSHASPPSAEAYFQRGQLRDAQLSPDGKSLAMLLAAPSERARLVVIDLATMKPTVVAAHPESGVAEFNWVSSRRLAYHLEVELTGPNIADIAPGLFAVDIDGKRYRQLVQSLGSSFVRDGGSTDRLLPWRFRLLRTLGTGQEDAVLVYAPDEVSKTRIGYYQVRRLNTVNGLNSEVDVPLHSRHWVFDRSGKPQAAVTYHNNQRQVLLRDAKGDWKAVATSEWKSSRDAVTPRWLAPDGTLYAQASKPVRPADPADRFQMLFTMDRVTGDLSTQPVLALEGFDADADFVASDKGLLGLHLQADAPASHWLDPAMKALQSKVDQLLTGTTNRLSVARDSASPWVLVHSVSDAQPDVWWLYHITTGKLSRLGSERSAFDVKFAGQTDFVRIPAGDGLQLPTYITVPATGDKKKLPLVVMVHGGPWVRGATWRWQAEVQFLASRGYAVMQPEFRGSAGYGSRLFDAGVKQWGSGMQDDLVSSVRWAVQQGIVDPKRVCVLGSSYGGYAAAMALARHGDVFACGVSYAGVTDLELLFSAGWSDLTEEARVYGLEILVGDPKIDGQRLREASPLHQANRIKNPLLLAHGAWDVRVPVDHAERLRQAVRPHNAALEWALYDNEGHGFQHARNEVDFWRRVETFLAKHIGAGR